MTTMTTDQSGERPTQTNVVPLPQKEQPVSAREQALAFVREHPVATIAGGLAVGAVAAALIPRRNRRYVARQGSLIADAIAAASASIAHQALSSIDTASTGVRRGAHAVATRAERAGDVVADKASGAAHAAYDRAQALLGRKPVPTLGERIAARAGEIAGRLRQ
jgi:ElaB/YqjD/DUF883 family membrane-anchored ribosome-binding protein